MSYECVRCGRDITFASRYYDEHHEPHCRSCHSLLKEPAERRIKCRECGSYDHADSWFRGDQLLEAQLCFYCNYWLRLAGSPGEVVTTDYIHYTLDLAEPIKVTSNAKALGFAGRRFRIEFADGSSVITNDLWYQGEIPEHLRRHFTPNATSVKETMK